MKRANTWNGKRPKIEPRDDSRPSSWCSSQRRTSLLPAPPSPRVRHRLKGLWARSSLRLRPHSRPIIRRHRGRRFRFWKRASPRTPQNTCSLLLDPGCPCIAGTTRRARASESPTRFIGLLVRPIASEKKKRKVLKTAVAPEGCSPANVQNQARAYKSFQSARARRSRK